jgi:predicted transposase YbfD/YdcC
MPAVASSPITPVLGQLRGLIADGESVPDDRQMASLMQVLAAVPDPRKRRGVRHHLVAVLVMSVCAVLGGMRSFVAIAQWARDSVESCPQLREQLGGIAAAPAESTFRRTLQRLDAAQLDRLLGAWAQTRTANTTPGEQDGLRAVAADGKTLRGSGSHQPQGDAAAQRHLLTVFDHTHGVVLGQVDVDAKTNEVPMLPTLLDGLDLAGVVVTADALHAVRSHADYLHARGAHYVLTVKPNQKALHAQLARLPWAQIPVAHQSKDRGHARRETRTLKKTAVADAAGPGGKGLLFPHAQQAIRIIRTRATTANGKKGKRSTETAYAITSLTAIHATGEQLAATVRGHWGIENRLHHVRDVTWDEDRSQIRTGNGPQVMASLRNLAISILRLTGHTNIAAGLRHHAHNPTRPLNAVLTS